MNELKEPDIRDFHTGATLSISSKLLHLRKHHRTN